MRTASALRALLAQAEPLMDAEAMLLIDDRQRERCERDPFLE